VEFETFAQKEVYEKIIPWLKEEFGSFLRVRPDAPAFGIILGSSYTVVGVYPLADKDATITTRSYVVTRVELVPDLLKFLLRKNDEMRFGAFGLDSEGDIFFEHTILGSSCDLDELISSIQYVVRIADEFDDQIRERWGGERAIDRGR
jgi:hypothetical protein